MALDESNKIDAVGIEKVTEKIILTILDGWDWKDSHLHLSALQAKLNAYFEFIEEGQLQAAYPAAIGRGVVIDVVTRYPLPPDGIQLLARATDACGELNIEIRTRQIDDGVTGL